MNKYKLREAFRLKVLKRDSNTCKVCGRKDVKLDAHHITDRHEMPNGGYVIENGITLCDTAGSCHLKAEQFHISDNKRSEPGFHPDDLYNLINSSYEIAFMKSELL